ncbi:CAP domain-containing protein [Kitasatospora sp. NPDC052896]|uniref:CAP domain-containing protein n=1 Tax=Kitasatospora sp. NPDC052896 TaxID=3364061 RepID=UPI0037CA3BB7
MSSHRRVDIPPQATRRHRSPRPPRLRLVVTSAAAVAVIGGGTAFACVGGTGGRPAPVAAGSADRQSPPVAAALGGQPVPSARPSQSPIPQGSGGAANQPPTHPAPTTPSAPTSAPSATPSPAASPTAAAAVPTRASSTAPSPASSAPAAPVPAVTPSATDSDAVQQVLNLINQARAAQGLPAYTLDDGLNRSAAAHNQVMAGGCGLSHQCPGEPAFGQREQDQGVQWSSAGENIGEGGPVSATDSSIASMAVGLTQSMLDEKPPNDGHRQNILSSSFTRVGIAIMRDSSGTIWLTQDFAG